MYNYLSRAITFNQLLNFQDPYLFRNRKSKSFQGCQDQPNPWRFGGGDEGPPPRKVCRGYKRPHTPFRQKKKRGLPWFCSLPKRLLHVFPLFQTQKTCQSFLILLSSPKTQGIVLIPNLLLLGSTSQILGLRVWMQLSSYYPHP